MSKRTFVLIMVVLGLILMVMALPVLAQDELPQIPIREENQGIPDTEDRQFDSDILELGGKLYASGIELENGIESALATGGPDEYGYTWDDSVPFGWIDVAGGIDTGLSGWSGYTGPIALPFDFKYYENLYSQVYITSSGYLSFDDEDLWDDQDEIPNPATPNNVIAPYWTPTYIDSGGWVRYLSGGSSPNRYFVVEWHDIKGGDTGDYIGGDDVFRFQVILHESGDIVFQYHTMTYTDDYWCGSSGIEDQTGQDGLIYIDYCDPIPSNKAVRFYRPTPRARVKVSPLYQGSFTKASQMLIYEISINNTGDLGADTYDFTTTSTWPLGLYHGDGSALIDTDGDTFIDTGPLAQGAGKTIYARVQTPNIVNVGDQNIASLGITSSLDMTKYKNLDLRSAVPAPFMQAYTDDVDGAMSLYLVKPDDQIIKKAAPDNTYGYDLSVAETPGSVYAWSNYWYFSDRGISVYEIEYTVLNDAGIPIRPVTKLTDHSLASISTYDYDPAVAVTPNGNIGVLWYRYQYDRNTDLSNYNVWLAVLDAAGNVLVPPINVTGNNIWGQGEDPHFWDPRIVATDDNRFVIAWYRRLSDGSYYRDILYAIYDSTGGQIKSPTEMTNAAPGDSYREPALTAITGNQALLAYRTPSSGIAYVVLNSAGNVLKTQTTFGGYGYVPDAVQFSTGNAIIAWTGYSGIEYVVLDNAQNVISGPTMLNNPVAVTGDDYVSVTADEAGHAILTWLDDDSDYRHHLYFALVDSTGNIQTQPMIFYTAGISTWGDQYVLTSYEGYGNTSYTIGSSSPQVDVYLQGPNLVGVPPGEVASIPIEFGNQGLTTATAISVTATLDANLSYAGDNSGITPTQNGQTLTWNFSSNLEYLGLGSFTLLVNAPNDNFGEQFPVMFEISSAQVDANPADNSQTVNVMIAHQIYLPLTMR